MILHVYTILHVLISLLGIASGFVVLYGLLKSQSMNCTTKFFLITTTATTVTGFFFPFHGFTPALATGVISLFLLGPAIYARYAKGLAGGWRKTYVITAMLAQYLNFFVLIVQSFQKIPALKELAPKQTEPPFAVTQGLALLAFIILIVLATKKFHPQPSGNGK